MAFASFELGDAVGSVGRPAASLGPSVEANFFNSNRVGSSANDRHADDQQGDDQQGDDDQWPKSAKPPAPSAAQQFVKHGARDPSTACTTARTEKNGQLDCGMHGKAAKPNPR
jgi:hypothetical protein